MIISGIRQGYKAKLIFTWCFRRMCYCFVSSFSDQHDHLMLQCQNSSQSKYHFVFLNVLNWRWKIAFNSRGPISRDVSMGHDPLINSVPSWARQSKSMYVCLFFLEIGRCQLGQLIACFCSRIFLVNISILDRFEVSPNPKSRGIQPMFWIGLAAHGTVWYLLIQVEPVGNIWQWGWVNT